MTELKSRLGKFKEAARELDGRGQEVLLQEVKELVSHEPLHDHERKTAARTKDRS